jgi:hypothetical protein
MPVYENRQKKMGMQLSRSVLGGFCLFPKGIHLGKRHVFEIAALTLRP